MTAQLDLFAGVDTRLWESQERARLARETFNAALDKGPTPATWFGVPCQVCSGVMWKGDMVVRVPHKKTTRVVHQECA